MTARIPRMETMKVYFSMKSRVQDIGLGGHWLCCMIALIRDLESHTFLHANSDFPTS